jgi:hypothetical protein
VEVIPGVLVSLIVLGFLWWWFAAGARELVADWIRSHVVDADFDPEVGTPEQHDPEEPGNDRSESGNDEGPVMSAIRRQAGQLDADPERGPLRCQAKTRSGAQCSRMGLPSWAGLCLQHARMALESHLDDPTTPRNEALERLREYLDND